MNAHAVRVLHAEGLVGAEFLALVPGQFGGAVVMNAGTRWGELSEILVEVRLATVEGEIVDVPVSNLAPSYRHGGVPPGAVVLSGTVRVDPGDADAARQKVRQEKLYRSQTQPYRLNTSGSIFANPPGDAAGRLIEAAGVKGLRWGGVEVSSVHANWIVNWSGGTALEVVQMMAFVRRCVCSHADVTLRPEVRLMGFSGLADSAGVGAFLDGMKLPARLQDLYLAHKESR